MRSHHDLDKAAAVAESIFAPSGARVTSRCSHDGHSLLVIWPAEVPPQFGVYERVQGVPVEHKAGAVAQK